MTDSRAALEEAAEKFWQEKRARAKCNVLPIRSVLADFAEQESSSLKLLLSAMWKGVAWPNALGELTVGFDGEYSFPVELDSSGIPVLTPEIIEALEAAK